MAGAACGGGVAGESFFEGDELVHGVGGFEELFVLADGQDGFADTGDDFEAGFFEECFDFGGEVHADFEAFGGGAGEPMGAAGFDEVGEFVEVAGLDEVVECGELVVDGEDEDAAGGEEAAGFGEAGGGIGADGDDVAHGGDELEVLGGEGAEVDGVGFGDGGAGGFAGQVGLGGPLGDFFADDLEHVV